MNFTDLRFVVLALGIGIGLGVAMAQKHGALGFMGGLLCAVAVVSLLLGCIRLVASIARKK